MAVENWEKSKALNGDSTATQVAESTQFTGENETNLADLIERQLKELEAALGRFGNFAGSA